MAFDLAAARAVQAAKLLERALHDPGPWFIDCGPFEVVADRVVTDEEVVFTASFPEHCWMGQPPASLGLRCRGRLCSIRGFGHPGDAAFTVQWTLSTKVPVLV